MREFDFIRWISSQAPPDPAVVPVGPGDDCAVVNVGEGKLLVTVDQVLDGVHFVLAEHGAAAAGRKAAARNLSDIAAMAGEPLAMVASLVAPAGFSLEQAQELYRGLREMADLYHCPLIGGDVAAWGEPTGRLQLSVTVLGRMAGLRPVLRSGAQPGDNLCVTGTLGGAWRGRRHLEFTPRIAEARKLASRFHLHAMIDISDGLASDVAHIAKASGVCAVIAAEAVPIHPDVQGLADPLAAALFDGEDYELLFALPAAEAEQLAAAGDLGVSVTVIGGIEVGEGVFLTRQGRREVLPPGGWEHRT